MAPWTSYREASCEFAESTSLAGVLHVKDKNPIGRRIFWLILVLTASGAALWQSYELIAKYYRFEVNVLLEVKFNNTLDFPAVSICNLNPIRKYKLTEFSDSPFADELQEAAGISKRNTTAASLSRRRRSAAGDTNGTKDNLNGTTAESYKDITEFITDDTESEAYWDEQTYDTIEEEDYSLEIQESMSELLAQLNKKQKEVLGHQLHTMLISCSFNGKKCGPKQFQHFFNPRYGNCYTFNSGRESKALEKTAKPGPSYGLTVELFVEQNEYIDELTHEAGMHVVVHDNAEMPFPQDQGLNIAPQFLTSIGVRRVQVDRLGPKFDKGNCTDSNVRDNRNIFYDEHKNDYSLVGCLKSCYQTEAIRRCQCGDSNYPLSSNASPCRSRNQKQAKCLEKVVMDFNEDIIECNCLPACREVTFSYTSSIAKWPSHGYAQDLVTRLSNKAPPVVQSLATYLPDQLIENMIKLEVYFEEFNYEYIFQKQAYTELDLASDFGGLLGLWIGFSIITAAELLELLVLYSIVTISKLLGFSNQQVGSKVNVKSIEGQETPPPMYGAMKNGTEYEIRSKRIDNSNGSMFI